MDNGNPRLTKDEFRKFVEMLSHIQISDVFIDSQSFKIIHETGDVKDRKIRVSIDITDTLLEINERLKARITFVVKIYRSKRKLFEQKTTYRVIFTLDDESLVKEILSDEKIKEFFLKVQLVKITWPFLREEFHSNCAKVGIRPLTLPLLK